MLMIDYSSLSSKQIYRYVQHKMNVADCICVYTIHIYVYTIYWLYSYYTDNDQSGELGGRILAAVGTGKCRGRKNLNVLFMHEILKRWN